MQRWVLEEGQNQSSCDVVGQLVVCELHFFNVDYERNDARKRLARSFIKVEVLQGKLPDLVVACDDILPNGNRGCFHFDTEVFEYVLYQLL